MNATSATESFTPPATQHRGGPSPRVLFVGGTLLAVASLAIYYLQVAWANVLVTPWYMAIGGTAAALMLLWSFARERRWWKVPVVLAAVGLAVLEWLFLGMSVLPAYAGPVKVGSPLPAFHAVLADGTPIDESYFQSDRPTVVVFFFGRWCPFCMAHLNELEAHREEIEKAGARVMAVSIEDAATAGQTQRDFPHLVAVADERREFASAVDVINREFGPDGQDAATPTLLLVDGQGVVQWVQRPDRFISLPSAAEIAARLKTR